MDGTHAPIRTEIGNAKSVLVLVLKSVFYKRKTGAFLPPVEIQKKYGTT